MNKKRNLIIKNIRNNEERVSKDQITRNNKIIIIKKRKKKIT